MAMQENMEIEFVDLIRDGYSYKTPLLLDQHHKTDQVIDYQMQLKSAEWVVFFYQTVLGGMPGVLKSYLDSTVIPGVAYNSQNIRETYFDEKKASVYVFEPKTQIESQLFHAAREDFFWKRVIFPTCGLKGEFKQYYATEKIDGSKIDSIMHGLHRLITSYRSRLEQV